MPLLPELPAPAELALFLDVDGTLLEIEERPDRVHSDARLNALLEQLRDALGGALSLVSGRPVADLDRIFAPARFPVAGGHGAELRIHAGDEIIAASARLPAPATAELEAMVEQHPRLLLEKKPGGVSLHYRRAPDLEPLCRRLMERLMVCVGDEFRLIGGKMVLELVPQGHHKGVVVREMMQHAPFTGRRPVFVGDDVTDEDGFRAVNEFGGFSVRVGDKRTSEARYVLKDVAAVRDWLDSLLVQADPERA